MDVDLRHVGHPGEEIPLHVRIHHLAGVAVEDAIFVESEVQDPTTPPLTWLSAVNLSMTMPQS